MKNYFKPIDVLPKWCEKFIEEYTLVHKYEERILINKRIPRKLKKRVKRKIRFVLSCKLASDCISDSLRQTSFSHQIFTIQPVKYLMDTYVIGYTA